MRGGFHALSDKHHCKHAAGCDASVGWRSDVPRVGARATDVYLNGTFGANNYVNNAANARLTKDALGYWAGFESDASIGDQYTFFVVNAAQGHKRDPYARQLNQTGFPDANGIVCDPNAYPWHDAGFQTRISRPHRLPDPHWHVRHQPSWRGFHLLDLWARFLICRRWVLICFSPCPSTSRNRSVYGLRRRGLFSPDFPYVSPIRLLCGNTLVTINALLTAKGFASLLSPRSLPDPLSSKHWSISVTSTAWPWYSTWSITMPEASRSTARRSTTMHLLLGSRHRPREQQRQPLFHRSGSRHGRPLFRSLEKRRPSIPHRQRPLLHREFHADGFRYDEISDLLSMNCDSGWSFCQDLTTPFATSIPACCRTPSSGPAKSATIRNRQTSMVTPTSNGGAGFDVVQHDGSAQRRPHCGRVSLLWTERDRQLRRHRRRALSPRLRARVADAFRASRITTS